MLLNEEKLVIKWLSQYQVLLYSQVVQMLHDKTPAVADKIIRNLKREHRIFDLPGGYLALDPLAEVDHRMIMAVWVMLKFIKNIEPMAHYPATYPAQIYFLKGETGYEIVVLLEGEQHLTKLLQVEDDTKYIFVTPNIDFSKSMVRPNVPCLFVTILDSGEGHPEVTFYSDKEAP